MTFQLHSAVWFHQRNERKAPLDRGNNAKVQSYERGEARHGWDIGWMEAEARQRFRGSTIRVQVQCRVGRWALPPLLRHTPPRSLHGLLVFILKVSVDLRLKGSFPQLSFFCFATLLSFQHFNHLNLSYLLVYCPHQIVGSTGAEIMYFRYTTEVSIPTTMLVHKQLLGEYNPFLGFFFFFFGCTAQQDLNSPTRD